MGNPGKRRLNEREPIPPKGLPAAPAWLTGESLTIWNEQAPVLASMDCLTVADRAPFARWCRAMARYLELNRLLEGKETTYWLRDKAGKPTVLMELPQAREWRQLHELLLGLERQFGMTPAARSRIQVGSDVAAPSVEPDKATKNERLQSFFARGRATGTGG